MHIWLIFVKSFITLDIFSLEKYKVHHNETEIHTKMKLEIIALVVGFFKSVRVNNFDVRSAICAIIHKNDNFWQNQIILFRNVVLLSWKISKPKTEKIQHRNVLEFWKQFLLSVELLNNLDIFRAFDVSGISDIKLFIFPDVQIIFNVLNISFQLNDFSVYNKLSTNYDIYFFLFSVEIAVTLRVN